MSGKAPYRKRVTDTIVAVQLDLDTAGFTYEKWGGTQTCKPGDWLVNKDGDIYTIDQQTFTDIYEAVGKGLYQRSVVVWAEVAAESGVIRTKEGSTNYTTGDYLVYNDEMGADGYAVSPEKFEALYDKI